MLVQYTQRRGPPAVGKCLCIRSCVCSSLDSTFRVLRLAFAFEFPKKKKKKKKKFTLSNKILRFRGSKYSHSLSQLPLPVLQLFVGCAPTPACARCSRLGSHLYPCSYRYSSSSLYLYSAATSVFFDSAGIRYYYRYSGPCVRGCSPLAISQGSLSSWGFFRPRVEAGGSLGIACLLVCLLSHLFACELEV